eukprot:8834247-Alexandrium_andersonii.AAC.1
MLAVGKAGEAPDDHAQHGPEGAEPTATALAEVTLAQGANEEPPAGQQITPREGVKAVLLGVGDSVGEVADGARQLPLRLHDVVLR